MNTPREALIGHTGYVGQTLQRQRGFSHRYRSTDIDDIRHQSFDTVWCAGAPAQKWRANADPAADRAGIERLIQALVTVRCERLVLISTVDVFASPCGVDESSPVDEHGLNPYGLHRRMLERAVLDHHPQALIVRLPGLVGPGLRKNAVYDLVHQHETAKIDSRGQFQFYPMVNLAADVAAAWAAGLGLVHLTAPPLTVADIAAQALGQTFENVLPQAPARYDVRTGYAAELGGSGPYTYTRRESLLALRAYAQSVRSAAEGTA